MFHLKFIIRRRKYGYIQMIFKKQFKIMLNSILNSKCTFKKNT